MMTHPEAITAKAERVLRDAIHVQTIAGFDLNPKQVGHIINHLNDATDLATAALSLTTINAKLLGALRDARNTIDLWGEYSQPITEQLVTISQAITEAEAMQEGTAVPVTEAGDVEEIVALAIRKAAHSTRAFTAMESIKCARAAIAALDAYRRKS